MYKLVGTDSPSGKLALFWIFPYYDGDSATTQNEIVICSTDKRHVYGIIDSITEISTIDEFIKTGLTYQWSPDESYLAVHNSAAKYSRLTLYDIRNELTDDIQQQGNQLMIPDLRLMAQQRIGILGKDVLSSGQIPVKWRDERTLRVTVRLKTPNKMRQVDFILRISERNEVKVIE